MSSNQDESQQQQMTVMQQLLLQQIEGKQLPHVDDKVMSASVDASVNTELSINPFFEVNIGAIMAAFPSVFQSPR
jgi:hypothetical protein